MDGLRRPARREQIERHLPHSLHEGPPLDLNQALGRVTDHLRRPAPQHRQVATETGRVNIVGPDQLTRGPEVVAREIQRERQTPEVFRQFKGLGRTATIGTQREEHIACFPRAKRCHRHLDAPMWPRMVKRVTGCHNDHPATVRCRCPQPAGPGHQGVTAGQNADVVRVVDDQQPRCPQLAEASPYDVRRIPSAEVAVLGAELIRDRGHSPFERQDVLRADPPARGL